MNKFNSISTKSIISHMSVCLVGVVMLLGSYITINYLIGTASKLATVSAPAVRYIKNLEAGLHQSMASIRGWVSIGDPKFLEERKSAWSKQIWPNFKLIEEIGSNHDVHASDINTLKSMLIRLNDIQWQIADVARTPGNLVSVQKFNMILQPISEGLFSYSASLMNLQREQTQQNTANYRLTTDIADFRAFFSDSHTSLAKFLDLGDSYLKKQFLRSIDQTIDAYERVWSRRRYFSKDQKEIFRTLQSEFTAYQLLFGKIVKLREGDDWNVALHLLSDSAIPLSSTAILKLEGLARSYELTMVEDSEIVKNMAEKTPLVVIISIFLLLSLAFFVSKIASMRLAKPLMQLLTEIKKFQKGETITELTNKSNDEIREIADAFYEMCFSIRANINLAEAKNSLNQAIQKVDTFEHIAQISLNFLGDFLSCELGVCFSKNEKSIRATSSIGLDSSKLSDLQTDSDFVRKCFELGEIIHVSEVDADYYLRLKSTFGEQVPRHILLLPLINEQGEVSDVFEFGARNPFDKEKLAQLKELSKPLAVAFSLALSRGQVNDLLTEAQEQSEELRQQTEELRTSNEELESQTSALKESKAELQTQQEEIKIHAEELVKKNEELKKRTDDLHRRNLELNDLQIDLTKQKKELKQASIYKSEFLANMSHELRTPLNSVLILSKMLFENPKNHLDSKEVSYASTIYGSGSDLLNLINDILDLSKIEAGQLEVNPEDFDLGELAQSIATVMEPISKQNKIPLNIEIEAGLDRHMYSDKMRIEQIVRNFLSNAFKFTRQGQVELLITSGQDYNKIEKPIQIMVKDSGIGIPSEQQSLIFEAFKQADGTISREFGGTGLGLSISTQLVEMLGGLIGLNSQEGKGSEFYIIIPRILETSNESVPLVANSGDGFAPVFVHNQSSREMGKLSVVKEEAKKSKKNQADIEIKPIQGGHISLPNRVDDDREILKEKEPHILIIEDDLNFSKILYELTKEKGLKCLVAESGESGLELANKFIPSGILLDLTLPGMNGWEVMEKIKGDKTLGRIPIHIVSGQNKQEEAMEKGAVGFLSKPFSSAQLGNAIDKLNIDVVNNAKKILVVEDDFAQQKSIQGILGEETVCTIIDSGKGAIELISSGSFDCVILDLILPDMTGFEVLEEIKKSQIKSPPIVVYTGKSLTKEESDKLHFYADSIVVKGATSVSRLLDETKLFLHSVNHKAGLDVSRVNSDEGFLEEIFENKTVLLVDDDIRNIFSLSAIIESKGIKVESAANGKEALNFLETGVKVDLILMDIMMPEMDGHTAIKKIRSNYLNKNLPIIALTAKAMVGDKEKCIESGANDYLSKPVDNDKLLSMLRIWFQK